MRKTTYLSLLPLIALLLSSCNLGSSNPSLIGTPVVVAGTGTVTTSVLRLTVQATNAGDTFNAPGQAINYQYTVTNTGVVPLTGNAIVSDSRVTVNCPNTNTVGNLDNALDPNESVICTSTYSITQDDLTAGSVIAVASANVGGFTSNQVSTTVTFTPAQTSGLKLMKTANPLTFSAAGQTIVYAYVIQNMGTAPIGPTQFTISDDKIGAPFNCGAPFTTLAPLQTINCSANYAVVPADVTAGRVINTATASGGGANVSAPATTTVTASIVPGPTANPNLTRGSTITHTVAKDEWMIQIARCYGVSFESVRNANLRVIDPDVIEIGETLTVPNIGSNGTIYGPPCIDHYTVQSGDTWSSIAQKFNADVTVLQAANPEGMTVGTVLLIPRNSAGSSIPVTSITSTPITATATLTPTLTPTPTGTLPTPTGTLATQTPPPTSIVTVSAQATPVTFPAGGSAVSIPGTLPPQGSVSYSLSASQGQILAINVTAPANEVSVSVTDPNGTPILPLSPTSFTWNVTLATTGNYQITITAIAGTQPKPYTLAIGLATPTPTSTRQP